MHILLVYAAGWSTFRRLGAIGLGLLAVADGFVLPLPGSVDILLVFLAASGPDRWWLYAFVATVGSVLGGYLSYRLGRKGGKEALEKRLPKKKLDKAYAAFDRWAFGAIFIPCLMPPPVPITPVLLTAGAMRYSPRKFLVSLTIGRAVRYGGLALLASYYGNVIAGFLSRYYTPILIAFIALVVLSSLAGGSYFIYRKRSNRNSSGKKKAA
jgi:membrane protein DedA with SNARE-associated domain